MKKILIVDDDANIREILEDFFRNNLKLQDLVFAEDGLNAYLEASLQKFDVICLDHSMPFLSGLDFCLALRTKPGLNQHSTIIIASAFIPEIKGKLESIENIFFVSKPLDFARLGRYVRIATNDSISPRDINL